MNVAEILAGGSGTRVGGATPKQFIDVEGHPVLAYTLACFERHPLVDAIEVVCHRDYKEYLRELVEREGFKKVRWITDGGATFQDSVINGLEYLRDKIDPDDQVLIHYGASPFTHEEVISDVIRVSEEFGNASPAMPHIYLACEREDGVKTTSWLNRDEIMRLNSPQAIRFGYALDIYERGREQGLLERIDPHTVSLMLAMGDPVYFSLDTSDNIKITTKEDLELFRCCVKAGAITL